MQVVFKLITLALVGATAGVHANELRGGTADLVDVAAAATEKKVLADVAAAATGGMRGRGGKSGKGGKGGKGHKDYEDKGGGSYSGNGHNDDKDTGGGSYSGNGHNDDAHKGFDLGGAFSGVALATGDQEPPLPPVNGPIDTYTTATVEFSFDDGFTKMDFRISVFDAKSDITMLHFHCAKAGLNGPIVVRFKENPPQYIGNVEQGTLYNSDIMPNDPKMVVNDCGLTINNLASLFQAMVENSIYLNVHTQTNPFGEVRGQILFPEGSML